MSNKVLYQCPECGLVYMFRDFIGPRWCDRGHTRVQFCQVWPAPSGWISVEEPVDLPDEWRGLVWLREPGTLGRWAIGRWIMNRWVNDRYIPLRCVTHYRPGPSAPEELIVNDESPRDDV